MTIVLVQEPAAVLQEPNVLHLVLHKAARPVQALTHQMLALTLDELALIADAYRYEGERNLLSAQLLDWTIDLLTFSAVSREEYVQGIVDRIQFLSKEILVNSFDKTPLEDPIFVDGVVAERWMWEDIGANFPKIKPEVHPLATEFVRWRNSLPIRLEPVVKPVLDKGIHLANRTPADQKWKVITYTALMRKSAAKDEMDRLQLMMREDVVQYRKIWEEARNAIANSVQGLDQALQNLAIAQNEEVAAEQSVAAIYQQQVVEHKQELKSCEREVKALAAVVVNQQRKLKETGKRLAAAEKTNAVQAGQIRQLRQQFASMQAQVAVLQQQPHKKKRFGIF